LGYKIIAQFHIDKPREIGKQKEKIMRKRNGMMVKDELQERVLRKKIREEIKSLKESGQGRLSTDQADVLQAIVMNNRKRGPRGVLKLVMKDKFLAPYIKKLGISRSELMSYIEEDFMMLNYM
jgi:hypothetical protein